jgi:DNA-damage-inducible protein D
MASQLSKPGTALFEQKKKVDESGHEFWKALDMAKVLEYSEYRHLLPVIEKAKEACKDSGHQTEDHFEQILEMVSIDSGAERTIMVDSIRRVVNKNKAKLKKKNMSITSLKKIVTQLITINPY